MQISEVMSQDVRTVRSTQSLKDAAKLMAECNVGALPVNENDRLVGMITDRDIAIRGVAAGKAPGTKIRDVMSKELLYCYEDEDIDHIAHNMGENQVRRLPVVNSEKQLVGILSLGDVALADRGTLTGEALAEVSEKTDQHVQHTDV